MKHILLQAILFGTLMGSINDLYYEQGLITRSEWQAGKAREAEVEKIEQDQKAKEQAAREAAWKIQEAEYEEYKAKNSTWGKVKSLFE